MLLQDFFRIEENIDKFHVPQDIYILSILLLPLLIYFSKYISFEVVVWLPFSLQMLAIFWHIYIDKLLLTGLPLYHCRLAMLLSPFIYYKLKGTQVATYWGLFATVGAMFAIMLPDLEKYSFPHITNFIFYLGHYFLFLAGIIYFRQYPIKKMRFETVAILTVCVHTPIYIINNIVGSNYAFLKNLPKSISLDINGFNLFLAVNILVIFSIYYLALFLHKKEASF